MINKKRIRFSNDSRNKLFLQKLYDILNDKESNDIIHWNSDGQSIVITNINKLCNKILPKYYRHTNYSSFVRQLNLYGFTKNKDYNDTKESVSFIHDNFNKSMTKEQIIKITRNNKKKKILSNIIKKSREEIISISNDDDLLLNNKDNLFAYLINKFEGDKQNLIRLKNENLYLVEHLKKIKERCIGHNIILKQLIKRYNNENSMNQKKLKNIQELSYNTCLTTKNLSTKIDNNKYKNQTIDSFTIYNDNNDNIKINNIKMNNINTNYQDSSSDNYPCTNLF